MRNSSFGLEDSIETMPTPMAAQTNSLFKDSRDISNNISFRMNTNNSVAKTINAP